MTKPISILVVDDDQSMAELACEILNASNFKTTYAKNGVIALALLSISTSFDLVLTDLDMPYINGIELIKQIKTSFPRVKTILMTGGSHKGVQIPEDIDYLEKPFDLEGLLSRVNLELEKTTGEKP